jgi:hypothetical protein
MLHSSQQEFINSIAPGERKIVHSGHMLYERSLVHHDASPWFIKAHDAELFTLDKKRDEALRYLEKEYQVYRYLHDNKYIHIPDEHHYKDGVLVLNGLRVEDGWHWKIPASTHSEAYITSILQALDTLESISTDAMFDNEPSVQFFWEKGWGSKDSVLEAIETHHGKWGSLLRKETEKDLAELAHSIDLIRLTTPPKIGSHISHHDIRQSNIAWHPEHGTVVVDWSWASHGVKGADATMFLIDLHKAGIDVTQYLASYFNQEYAKLLIGYWLLRVGEPSAQGNDEVRLHQLISAISAFELLQKLVATP